MGMREIKAEGIPAKERVQKNIAALFTAGEMKTEIPLPGEDKNVGTEFPHFLDGAAGGVPELRELPVLLLDEMEQPFRLRSEKELEAMRDSIAQHGIIQRIIVRPSPDAPGRYQIISGRHRRRGAIMAGYAMVPCEIRYLDDDEACIQMVETNLLQRDSILPSEKAWAYRIRLEALIHQGKRTSRQFGKLSVTMVSEDTDESERQIHRYIRLTYLLPELLEAVDDGSLGFVAGGTLSYLSQDNQSVVHNYFFVEHKQPISGALAEALREGGEKGLLTDDQISTILSPDVNKPVKIRRVSVPMRPLRKFFPASASAKEIEKQIVEIVTEYFRQKSGN